RTPPGQAAPGPHAPTDPESTESSYARSSKNAVATVLARRTPARLRASPRRVLSLCGGRPTTHIPFSRSKDCAPPRDTANPSSRVTPVPGSLQGLEAFSPSSINISNTLNLRIRVEPVNAQ